MTASSTSPLSEKTRSAVHERLKKSILSPLTAPNSEGKYDNGADQRTYVENPYRDINKSGINKAPESVLRKNPKIDPAQGEYLLSDEDWAATLGRSRPDPTLKRDESKTRPERVKIWLDSARSVAGRDALPGFCNLFAMVTVVLLVADNDTTLDAHVPVEWIGSGDGFRGHMTVVVNREPDSDVTDADSWGDNYLIVDYWYGLQSRTGPIFLPRKKTAIASKSSAELDEHDAYRTFFDQQGVCRSKGMFRPGSYRPLRVPVKAAGTF